MSIPTIAYLAPEIPALSATFVYEELHALEMRGVAVIPLSVHVPSSLARDEKELAERTKIIYDRRKWRIVLFGLLNIHSLPGLRRAAGWLFKDICTCRFSLNSLKLAFQFLAAVRVAKILRENDAVHMHIHFAHTPTQIGMYAAAFAKIPFTVTAHANDIFERGLLLLQKSERAHKFLTISEHNLVHLRSLGLASDALAVVRCSASFKPPSIWPQPAPRPRYKLGTLGRLVEKKGVDVLLRALVDLEGAYLSIAGEGPLRKDLEALVHDLGIESSVEFVGSIPHHKVSNWLADLDIFVLACRKDRNGDMDGIPVALMEAMSQGIPVVSTHISGIPELVTHKVNGLLSKPEDHIDLAKQINLLLESSTLRNQLALNARYSLRQEFGQQLNTDRLLSHFGLEH